MNIQQNQILSGTGRAPMGENVTAGIHENASFEGWPRITIKAGTALFRAGDPSTSLYTIVAGFFKTIGERQDGNEQILGFHMPNEMLGLAGIDHKRYTRNAIALQDSVVTQFPFPTQGDNSDEQSHTLRQQLYRNLGDELIREQNAILLLGCMSAKAKIAAFFLQLSDRFMRFGYSQTEFNLFMSRYDIASYLGVVIETLSRTLSQMEREGLIAISGRNVRILNRQGLVNLMGEDSTPSLDINNDSQDEVKSHQGSDSGLFD